MGVECAKMPTVRKFLAQSTTARERSGEEGLRCSTETFTFPFPFQVMKGQLPIVGHLKTAAGD